MYNWDRENCPLYGVVGCPLFRGCLSIEVNGRTVGTFRIVRISWMSAVQECPLSGVPLYNFSHFIFVQLLCTCQDVLSSTLHGCGVPIFTAGCPYLL